MLTVSQILYQGTIRFAEVKYFFIKNLGGELIGLAIVSLYSLPNEYLLQLTNDTLIVCGYQGDQSLAVIRVKLILSVVAMIPFPHFISTRFMVEKIGLDVIDTDHRGDDDEE